MFKNTLPENCFLQLHHLLPDEWRRALSLGETYHLLLQCDSEGYRPPKWHSYKEASSFYAMRGKSRSNCYSD